MSKPKFFSWSFVLRCCQYLDHIALNGRRPDESWVGKRFERKWSWPNPCNIPEFAWRNWRKPRKKSVMTDGIPTEIRDENLPNASLECYRYAKPPGVQAFPVVPILQVFWLKFCVQFSSFLYALHAMSKCHPRLVNQNITIHSFTICEEPVTPTDNKIELISVSSALKLICVNPQTLNA
jgi:hypothetical protein